MSSVLIEDLRHDLVTMARVVHAQLETALEAFHRRDVALAGKVVEKDDHVDNLLGFIEETSFARIAAQGDASHPRVREIRGVFRLAVNLEKVGDYAVNIAEQAVHVAAFGPRPAPFDLLAAGRVAVAALDDVVSAFVDSSASRAKRACRCETTLDAQYRAALTETFRRLGRGDDDPTFVITHLFVAKFLERVGDSILNIGEIVLFVLTGERLKLHQYLHLEEMKGAVAGEPRADAPIDFRQIWGGISGARVGRLSAADGRAFIWKEGAEAKIEGEVREMAEWNRIRPGLVPDVLTRYQDDGRESFLGHFLDGQILRDVYLTASWTEKLAITRRLLATVGDVWRATAHPDAPEVSYVRQVRERLPELFGYHPELATLRGARTRVFGIAHASIDELLSRAAVIEPALVPKTRVRIHGDFNTNNVIWNPRTERIHFIDVHRSGPGDYLQDIGVFLVSLIRNPLQDQALVAEMERLDALVVEFVAAFAAEIGDAHFAPRLTLSRARSLITSARIVTDTEFARVLYLRGVRLLEKLTTGVATETLTGG